MGILLLLVAFVLPGAVIAQQPSYPCRFWGTVKVNGNWVASGTLITAWIDGTTGSWTANTGSEAGQPAYAYSMTVYADEPSTPTKDGGVDGDVVRFKVRYGGIDYVAPKTGVWSAGEFNEVNLEISLVTATLSGQPTGLVNYRTATITVDGTGVAAYKYKLDSGALGPETPVSTQISLSGLTDGSHTVYVIGKDSFDNWQAEANATTTSWTVDATPPTATLAGQPTGAVNYTTADITVAGTDVVAYECKLDSDTWSAGEIAVGTHITLSGLSDGTHTVSVIGKDTAGNWQAKANATTASWTVDTIPPTATLSGQPTGWVNYKTTNITVGGADVATYKYKLDSDIWSAVEIPVGTHITLSGLSDGTHTVSVIGKDAAGNWQAEGSAATASWKIDTILPTITVARDGVSFSGTAADAASYIASVQYRLDGGGWANATASDGAFNGPSEAYSFTLAALANGSHTVEVRATDAAGNLASQSLSFESKELYFDGNLGWNSVSYLGSDKPVTEALSSIWGKFTVVWFFDSQSGKWYGYNPNVPAWANDLAQLKNNESYWIKVTAQCYWTYGG
jgi:hypothetical protein